MDARPDMTASWEELASRTTGGLEVTLLWQRDRKDVNIRVIDARTEDAFELTVAGKSAFDAFYHPYAYAA
jgi:hypothetical protein